MKITFEDIVQRIIKLEKILEKDKMVIEEKELLIRVLNLDVKHHGWTGDMRYIDDDREEWKEAAETVKLIRDWDKEHAGEQ